MVCRESQITQQNTRWLERVATLTKTQYDLEDQLNTSTKDVHVSDTTPLDERSDQEQRQLVSLVQMQVLLVALEQFSHILHLRRSEILLSLLCGSVLLEFLQICSFSIPHW